MIVDGDGHNPPDLDEKRGGYGLVMASLLIK